MEKIRKFRNSIREKIELIGQNEATYSILFVGLSLFVGVIHVLLLVLFLYSEAYVLAGINGISVLFYGLCMLVSKKGKVFISYNMIIGEVFAFSVLFTYLVGQDFLFHMYCLATIPFTFLTYYVIGNLEREKKPVFHPVLYCVIAIVLYFLEQSSVWGNPPYGNALKETSVIQFIRVFNILVDISCSMIGGISLSTVALGNIRMARGNMKRIEELAREAEESNMAKSTFLANMSHEIRTPMNAICGMADILLDQELSPEGEECTASIKSASTSLLSIINDILDFSKLESGRLDIVPEEYYISSVLNDLINMMEVRVRDKSVKVVADVQDIIPRKLYGDSGRIRQILINIMGNATKFTQEGSITMSVYWKPIDRKYGKLHFSIKDTGIGIKNEDIDKLFNAFEQVDIKKNKGIEGTGLGLSICRLLVGQMGGEIWVESEYGKGSTFYFYIIQEVKDATPCEFSRNQAVEVKKFEVDFKAPEAKVMVVDDMNVNLRVAAGILKKFDIVPDLVESGVDCVEMIKRQKDYELIFMDHMMPGMDGIEATKEIRAMNEEYTDKLPIVALSANAVKGMETEFKAGGMNDFIPKPIDVERLGRILKKWLPKEKIVPVTLDK